MEGEHDIFTPNCREQENGNELRTWFEYELKVGGDYRLRHYETLFSIGGPAASFGDFYFVLEIICTLRGSFPIPRPT